MAAARFKQSRRDREAALQPSAIFKSSSSHINQYIDDDRPSAHLITVDYCMTPPASRDSRLCEELDRTSTSVNADRSPLITNSARTITREYLGHAASLRHTSHVTDIFQHRDELLRQCKRCLKHAGSCVIGGSNTLLSSCVLTVTAAPRLHLIIASKNNL
jgi:hypothetical protein